MEAPSEMSLSYQPQAAQAVTSLPAQSSNLFQNAAGFHIIGGQFVSGDVHNHQNTSPANTGVSSSPLNVMDENFSESEIYCNQLLRRKRGFPLYVPAPSQNLPAAYRRKGVAIGDVGRVTPEGIFDFFFNIYLPADHPINDNHVPETFLPLIPYDSRDIVNMTYDPGDCVTTSSVQMLALDPPLDEFPGGDFVFSCGVPQGAILALPHGGHLEKLENVEAMREYAATHAESWYKYITEVRGRALANGALYLVTGCEKAQSWGMSSFYSVDDQFQLAFKPRIRPDSTSQYRWSGVHGHRLPAQHKSYNSPPNGGPLNQTTFIHGLSISLGVGLWAKLFAKVEIRDIGESQLGGVNGNSMPYSAGSSLFSWSLGILGGGAPAAGKQHTEQRGNAFLSDISPISKIFHPGELINAYILHRVPQATVVLSHDDDWCDILSDEASTGYTVQTVSELIQQIREQFDVVEEDGAAFLSSTAATHASQDMSTVEVPARTPESSDDVPTEPTGEGSNTSQFVPQSKLASSAASVFDQTVHIEYVMAMHDYAPQHQPEDTTCLSFRAGQVIHVLNRDSSGWWDGELEGRRGWFPSNYVDADLNALVDDEPVASQTTLQWGNLPPLDFPHPSGMPRAPSASHRPIVQPEAASENAMDDYFLNIHLQGGGVVRILTDAGMNIDDLDFPSLSPTNEKTYPALVVRKTVEVQVVAEDVDVDAIERVLAACPKLDAEAEVGGFQNPAQPSIAYPAQTKQQHPRSFTSVPIWTSHEASPRSSK